MEEHVIVDSSFSTVINAPREQIDIPSWCFSLPDDEYQSCSLAHCAAGSTARDGREYRKMQYTTTTRTTGGRVIDLGNPTLSRRKEEPCPPQPKSATSQPAD